MTGHPAGVRECVVGDQKYSVMSIKIEKVHFFHECTGPRTESVTWMSELTAESRRDTTLALGKGWQYRAILT